MASGTEGGNLGAWLRCWWAILVVCVSLLVGLGVFSARVDAQIQLLVVRQQVQDQLWTERMNPVLTRLSAVEATQDNARAERALLGRKIDRLLVIQGVDPDAIR